MPHIVVSPCSVSEALVPFEVQKEPLEEMGEVKDPIAAPLEHFDLVVQPFHKATVLARQEIIGDLLFPLLKRVQKAVVTAQAASSHSELPVGELLECGFFGQGASKRPVNSSRYAYACCNAGEYVKSRVSTPFFGL